MQVGTLVALVKSTQQLLRYAAGSVLSDFKDDEEELGDLILVEIEGVGEMSLDISKLQSYGESISLQKRRDVYPQSRDGDDDAEHEDSNKNDKIKKNSDKNSSRNKKYLQGSSAASLLLQLEFVFEVLENKTFHKQLVPLVEAENGSEILQSYFLELSEQVLQLLALASRAQVNQTSTTSSSTANSKESNEVNELKKQNNTLKSSRNLCVQLGDTLTHITIDSLGSSIGIWCLEILKSMQKVLDAPAFVAILQVFYPIFYHVFYLVFYIFFVCFPFIDIGYNFRCFFCCFFFYFSYISFF